MNEYTLQAEKFLKDTETRLSIEFNRYDKYFNDDNQYRNIYKCKLQRNGKQYSFEFGDSVYNTTNGIEPSSYDILACLQKYEVGTFENFLHEFGYEITSNETYKQVMKTYKAVTKEYKAVEKLFSDVIEELYEIN